MVVALCRSLFVQKNLYGVYFMLSSNEEPTYMRVGMSSTTIIVEHMFRYEIQYHTFRSSSFMHSVRGPSKRFYQAPSC